MNEERKRQSKMADWRSQHCSRCGHEWFRRHGSGWFCARCDWPPPKRMASASGDAMRIRLLLWIDAELKRRTGNGSYARGQRWMLNQFREEVLK